MVYFLYLTCLLCILMIYLVLMCNNICNLVFVCREGIQFVVGSSSFPFLEILSEFSGKLMKQDKKVV